ncbi:acetyltransferase, GNAT family [Amniculicola lignicola CBS 123094]|uniref:Acetyltransferase, GNAT family n=1 Tax=Amniculicola lignicola CBS 123094 TaxID=1392246 RepID=A0A6A5X313_9PLEO|nr:acetyltransferase, GNAT family [Amniculicola lignicola CBS 123094]
MDNSAYVILSGLPKPQNYYDLRKIAGMTPAPIEAIPKALSNSFCSLLAYERSQMIDSTTPSPNQDAVAMGRLIGDGALFLQLCDIAVHPEHQGKGLGKRITKQLMEYVDEHAKDAYVSLVASQMGQGLYAQYGFEDLVPHYGMFRCPRIQNDQEYRRKKEEKVATLLKSREEIL